MMKNVIPMVAVLLLTTSVACGPDDESMAGAPNTYAVGARMEMNEKEQARLEEIVKDFPSSEVPAVREQLRKGGMVFSRDPKTQKKINDLRAEMGTRWAVEQDAKRYPVAARNAENTYNPTAEEQLLITQLLNRIEPSKRASLRERLLRSDAQVLSVRDPEGDRILKKIYDLRAERKD